MPYTGSYIWKVRQKIGHDPLIMPSADAVAIRDDGKLLVIFNKDQQNWFFPGGYVEEGQTSNECAARELLEEAGIEADPAELIPFAFSSGHRVQYPNGDTTFPFTQLFMVPKWHETNRELDDEEIGGRQWLSIAELRTMSISTTMQKSIEAYETFLKTHEYQMIDLKDA